MPSNLIAIVASVLVFGIPMLGMLVYTIYEEASQTNRNKRFKQGPMPGYGKCGSCGVVDRAGQQCRNRQCHSTWLIRDLHE